MGAESNEGCIKQLIPLCSTVSLRDKEVNKAPKTEAEGVERKKGCSMSVEAPCKR